MAEGDWSVTEVWVSEHYWPELASELVTAQAQRLTRTAEAVATVVLPGEQTAFGLHLARGPEEVRRALAVVGLGAASVGAGWLLRPPAPSGPGPWAR